MKKKKLSKGAKRRRPETLFCWHKGESHAFSATGKQIYLNSARPVTKWRKFRNWLAFYESDTLTEINKNEKGPNRLGCSSHRLLG